LGRLFQKAFDYKVSRRNFIKGSAVAAAGIGLLGKGSGLTKVSDAVAQEVAEKEGEWIAAACWHNCGGRCPNYVLVQDGVVIRQKTDDTHPDNADYPQQRGCLRGRAQRFQVFGADRLKYPMKRKNWEPGGGKKELRGRDEWERISWDEALDIVAGELKRIKEAYGNEAILSRGSEIGRTLTLFGGCVQEWGTTSGGSWRTTGQVACGTPLATWGYPDSNDRMDHRNTELFVLWGSNPSWSSGGGGFPTYNALQNKKIAGSKYIFIDPFYNDSIATIGDEWIPIRPATDHAMLLGMVYTLITEDDPQNNPLIDWNSLYRLTTGFDRDHMPAGADPNENFRDYVLGLDENGKPAQDGHKNYPAKTPEWASEICGVDPARIRSLAIEIARTKNVALCSSSSPARVHNSDHLPQLFMTLGYMTGHVGKSGSFTCGGGYKHAKFGFHTPDLVMAGSTGVPSVGANPVSPPSNYFTAEPIPGLYLNHTAMWNEIVSKKHVVDWGKEVDLNIQCIYHGVGAMLQCVDGMTKGIEAHRQVEFVVTQAYCLTTEARYSDIVLPVTTQWERYGGFGTYSSPEVLVVWQQVTEPLGEAKDDIWIAKEVGARLGLDANLIDPISSKQQFFNQLAGAKVINEAGTDYEPLVTITAEDIAKYEVNLQPQEGRIKLEEFLQKGYYQVKRSPNDNYRYIAYEDFYKDPEANPIPTQTGKMEIHSAKLASVIKSRGYNEIRPIPTYDPPAEGYEDTFQDWKNKVKGELPLQLYTIHYLRRSHSVFDNVPHLRRAWPQPLFINPLDAKERGIRQGDTVLVTSRHGRSIRPACVTPRIMPGVVSLPHGAWVEMEEESGIDKAGADNIINGGIPTGQGTSGWNSCNVQVEKWTGAPLEADYKWPQRIPLKEA